MQAAWKAADPRSLGGIFDACHTGGERERKRVGWGWGKRERERCV